MNTAIESYQQIVKFFGIRGQPDSGQKVKAIAA